MQQHTSGSTVVAAHPVTAPGSVTEPDTGLKRGLTARHVRFMALGSAIGTGLFMGS